MITVTHRLGAYEIDFPTLGEAWTRLPGAIRVITDKNVYAAWGRVLPENVPAHILPPGERTKSLAAYEACLHWLAASRADRSTTVVAFGGGVVGDLAGFVAATYMRGIPCVQVPTTLLAQVDSSVGGKVGIDLEEGKNLVGAFHNPAAVSVCLETLSTLPDAEFANGMAEVWKYGFAVDANLLPLLETAPLNPRSEALSEVVRKCIQLKADIVQEDELDLSGRRAILNFGHTVGHALEKVEGYEGIRHGEAVAIGMVVEARLGERLGISPPGIAGEIAARLQSSGLPIDHPNLSHPSLIAVMRSDKKAAEGEIAVCLLSGLGECKLVPNVPAEEVEAALCPP